MLGNEAYVLRGKRAWQATTGLAADVLRPDVMFDRIINVKINYALFTTLANGSKEYYLRSFIIIRSDYERVSNGVARNSTAEALAPVYKAVNGVTNGAFSPTNITHYEKVRIKPDIRITYRGYGNLSVNFELVINNFFTLVGDGDIAMELNGATEGIEITNIEILFGYMSQFPDISKLPAGVSSTVYNDFTNKAYSNVSYMCGDVLYWYRSSVPPDAAYTFYCCVTSTKANTFSQYSLISDTSINLSYIYESVKVDYRYYIMSRPQTLETMLDWYITKHYIRPNVKPVLENPMVYNKAALSLTDYGSLAYGVQVFSMSYKIHSQPMITLPETFIPFESNVVSMLNNIKDTFYPNLEFKFDVDGNVYVYDMSEDLDSLETKGLMEEVYDFTDAKINKFVASVNAAGSRVSRPTRVTNTLTIPAVYALQYGPLTQISCPYFSTLFPGQRLMYNASYSTAINQVASIDTNAPALEVFTLLYYDIDFSTVSEYNNMELYVIRAGLQQSEEL